MGISASEAVAGAVVLALAAGLYALLSGGRRKERAPSAAPDGESAEEGSGEAAEEAVEMPIDGTLDLHHFSAKEVGELVPDYLDACRARGIRHVRVIHGKGKGVLLRKTWSILRKHPDVVDYRLAGRGGGDWGATEVTLRAGKGGRGRRRRRR